MNWLWFLFASLTVLGSLMYNVGVKIGGNHINPFIFTIVLTAVAFVGHVVCTLVYKHLISPDEVLAYDAKGIWMGVLAGLAVVVIDLAYFYSVKTGGAIASQAFWTVGGMIALTVFAVVVFKEDFTLMKALGVTFGIAGLYLTMRG